MVTLLPCDESTGLFQRSEEGRLHFEIKCCDFSNGLEGGLEGEGVVLRMASEVERRREARPAAFWEIAASGSVVWGNVIILLLLLRFSSNFYSSTSLFL